MKKQFNALSTIEKIALIITIVIAIIFLLVFFYKVFPYLVICLFLIWHLWDNYKDNKEKRMQRYIFEQSQLEAIISSLYDEMTLSLFDTLKEFSKELGVKVTNASSITVPDRFYSTKYGFPIYRYKLRITGEQEYCLNDMKDLIQFRLDQKLFIDRLWIFAINKKGNHLEVLALWNNCKLSNDFICLHEQKKHLKENANNTVPKDVDF